MRSYVTLAKGAKILNGTRAIAVRLMNASKNEMHLEKPVSLSTRATVMPIGRTPDIRCSNIELRESDLRIGRGYSVPSKAMNEASSRRLGNGNQKSMCKRSGAKTIMYFTTAFEPWRGISGTKLSKRQVTKHRILKR